MNNEVLTVTQLQEYINQTLEFAYPEVVVEGEIANFKVSQNKWVFFDIKDNESSISCFMSIYQLNTELSDGMLVRTHCSPKLTKWGKFSLTIRSIELAGEGTVKKAFELLKLKLTKEGLFDPLRKRPLPNYPQRVALITSRQAAAYNDFVTILNDRWAGVAIDLMQVQVQGEAAPEQIVRAIDYFNDHANKYDVLVVIRGGGSAEDLQAFATEPVTRAVYASKVPTLVGIGHEDDVSLAELAADVRAATPSDAARLLVPDRTEVINGVSSMMTIGIGHITQEIQRNNTSIDKLEKSFSRLISTAFQSIEGSQHRLVVAINLKYSEYFLRFQKSVELLRSLDPQAVLARGYAIVKQEGVGITDSSKLNIGQNIVIQLHKGSVQAKINKIVN